MVIKSFLFRVLLSAALLTIGFLVPAVDGCAGQAEAMYEASDKVQVFFSKDKSTWTKIVASGEAALKSDSSRDIQTAYTIAEAKAKARIAHFLKETVSSSFSVDDVYKKISDKDGTLVEQDIKIIIEKNKGRGRGDPEGARPFWKGRLTML